MERMTAFDAGFLDAEDADRHVSLAVGAVSVVDGPMPDFDEIVAAIGEKITTIPRLRQVVRRQPLDLSAPEWVEDPALDLAHHIRRAALPHPGDDAALFRFTAEAMEPRLDRERPLWQAWIIEGLADDRWAILMKVHHCIADGIAAMHMLAGLSDGGEGESYAGAIRAAHEVGAPRPTLPSPTLNPVRWARAGWNATTAVAATAAMTVEGAIGILSGLVRNPESSLNGPVTTMRRYSAVQVPLAKVASVCQAFDVTLNDVALAAITDSFRSALKRRGEEPHRDSLRTLVPVSVRSDDARDRLDNRVSVMLPHLPVDEPDPVEQLRTVHRRLNRAKSSGQRQAGTAAVAVVKLIPFALATRAIRVVTSLPQHGVVTLATNVPGPQHRLQVMGREVVRMFPVPPMALRLRTAVAILSYGDDLIFGITTDFDAFPDVDDLAAGIGAAVDTLAVAARPL
ncbi:WS/DGAT/MGAT family O-acyltransferase [Mycolicibacterium gilvum]|uniref:WS/DGAT/MGAT family O-acyltransferase n=1 Tax=Mycolicibacterium gilvum TaxID=1804 RepID=UPI0005A19128